MDGGKAPSSIEKGGSVFRIVSRLRKEIVKLNGLAIQQPIQRLAVQVFGTPWREVKCASLEVAESTKSIPS